MLDHLQHNPRIEEIGMEEHTGRATCVLDVVGALAMSAGARD
jgi:hypothetical protein